MEYNDRDLRFLLSDIPEDKRIRYLDNIWKGCTRAERKEMLKCLESYIQNEGSLTKTSDELFIHKNTLQYRLAKIKNITGYDPRKLSEAIHLYIAVLLEEFGN